MFLVSRLKDLHKAKSYKWNVESCNNNRTNKYQAIRKLTYQVNIRTSSLRAGLFINNNSILIFFIENWLQWLKSKMSGIVFKFQIFNCFLQLQYYPRDGKF